MAFNYPYGDTQQLNLNWFLSQWETFRAQWATAEEGIDHALDAEIARVEAAMTDLYAARDAAAASQAAAQTAAVNAASSQTIATQQASLAQSQAATAQNQAGIATAAAEAAGNSASSASNSASNANLSKVQAGNSATAAGQSATLANEKATAAGLSAAQAGVSAANAAGSAEDSEAWAVGERGGTPVASGDDTYENNSKYYADQAAAVAESIPEDYTELSNDVSELKTAITPLLTPSKNLLNLGTLTANYYVNKDNGNLVAYNNWSASDFIPIDYGNYELLYKSNGAYVKATGQNLYWAAYDSEKHYTHGALGANMSLTNINDAYLRVSSPSSYYNNEAMVVKNPLATELVGTSTYIPYGKNAEGTAEEIDSLKNNQKKLSGSESLIYDSTTELTSGYFIDGSSGLSTSNSNSFCTDYLDVSGYSGDVLCILTASNTSQYAGLASYDKDKTYIDGILYNERGNVNNLTLTKFSYQLPKNAKYIRITVGAGVTNDFAILVDNTETAKLMSGYTPNKRSAVLQPYYTQAQAAGMKIYLSDAWKTNAMQAYEAMQNYLRGTNQYDFVSMLIETDSHGRGSLPFSWMNEVDESIRCSYLGDIANDYYNRREMEAYYYDTQNVPKLITLVGNHDAHYSVNGGQGNQYDLIRFLNSTNRQMVDGDPYGCFSIVDKEQRIKFICLNPYIITTGSMSYEITNTQMAWLISELENSEYDIIVLSHNAINDTGFEDRDGNSGDSHIGGPYPVGYDQINALLKAYKNKGSGTVSTYNLPYDFTNVSKELIANICGHVHYELMKFDTYLTYAADWYGDNHCCTFVAVNRKTKKLAIFRFDNTTVYTTLELDYVGS